MKRIALAVLVLSTIAVGAAYAGAFAPGGAPGWTSWSMAIGIAAMMVSIMALGALREGGDGRGTAKLLAFPFAFTFLVLAGGFGLALALPDADTARMSLWLGLPPRAAIIVYGVGLLPFLVLPYAYARTFERVTLREEDIERVRRAAEQAPPAGMEDAA